jgi:hypothetical protein
MGISERIQGRLRIMHGEAIANHGGTASMEGIFDMNFRTTAIVVGLAAALGTGAAFAQSYSQDYASPQQQAPYGHQHRHQHGVLALIREEVRAGRIGHKEGTLLEQRIKEMKAERKAARQARYEGGQGSYGRSYGEGSYPPPSSQQPR